MFLSQATISGEKFPQREWTNFLKIATRVYGTALQQKFRLWDSLKVLFGIHPKQSDDNQSDCHQTEGRNFGLFTSFFIGTHYIIWVYNE